MTQKFFASRTNYLKVFVFENNFQGSNSSSQNKHSFFGNLGINFLLKLSQISRMALISSHHHLLTLCSHLSLSRSAFCLACRNSSSRLLMLLPLLSMMVPLYIQRLGEKFGKSTHALNDD
jgi:hypothetical protein